MLRLGPSLDIKMGPKDAKHNQRCAVMEMQQEMDRCSRFEPGLLRARLLRCLRQEDQDLVH